jgi:hypothetical protein
MNKGTAAGVVLGFAYAQAALDSGWWPGWALLLLLCGAPVGTWLGGRRDRKRANNGEGGPLESMRS